MVYNTTKCRRAAWITAALLCLGVCAKEYQVSLGDRLNGRLSFSQYGFASEREKTTLSFYWGRFDAEMRDSGGFKADLSGRLPLVFWEFQRVRGIWTQVAGLGYGEWGAALSVEDSALPVQNNPLQIRWRQRNPHGLIGLEWRFRNWALGARAGMFVGIPTESPSARHFLRDSLIVLYGRVMASHCGKALKWTFSGQSWSAAWHGEGLRRDMSGDIKRYALWRTGLDWNRVGIVLSSPRETWGVEADYDWVYGVMFPTRRENLGETFAATRLFEPNLTGIFLLPFYDKSWDVRGAFSGGRTRLGGTIAWFWNGFSLLPAAHVSYGDFAGDYETRLKTGGWLIGTRELKTDSAEWKSLWVQMRLRFLWDFPWIKGQQWDIYGEQWILLWQNSNRAAQSESTTARKISAKGFRNGFFWGAQWRQRW